MRGFLRSRVFPTHSALSGNGHGSRTKDDDEDENDGGGRLGVFVSIKAIRVQLRAFLPNRPRRRSRPRFPCGTLAKPDARLSSFAGLPNALCFERQRSWIENEGVE